MAIKCGHLCQMREKRSKFSTNLTVLSSIQKLMSYPTATSAQFSVHQRIRLAQWRHRLMTGTRRHAASGKAYRIYFSTTKLPMISASMPELKKVRMASVGVCTIASPRRLNEVFMITGTPVRFSNSSMSRQ